MTTSDLGKLPSVPNLQLRAALIARIQLLLASNNWTQQEAARICGQIQPRISDLRRGATERFSLDAFVNIAAALARYPITTEGGLMEYTEAYGERLVAEFIAQLEAKPVKGRYPAATECSITERGGRIVASRDLRTAGGRVALVGDIARYPDGGEARIVSGAGAALLYKGRMMALVGSELDNGDRITGPMHNGMMIV
ncbi:putative XRE-type DNA-binding protein [Massilia sp. MP_M2]|uniref:XRE family transcriptional regulator n=1 Tax=Massilia sp. MP_M2 TaxID=3071713 RepID=UPI00319E161C